ncbi:MAG: hypothetical protein AAB561_00200 [Patescibacteria group bacterium]
MEQKENSAPPAEADGACVWSVLSAVYLVIHLVSDNSRERMVGQNLAQALTVRTVSPDIHVGRLQKRTQNLLVEWSGENYYLHDVTPRVPARGREQGANLFLLVRKQVVERHSSFFHDSSLFH